MEYTSLARKYRPQTLKDVKGQDNVVKMLINSINMNMLSHAYLFVGHAGTGKTSFARILSKTLNCKEENSPCCKCDICKSIAEGKNLDVIELNAADKRGIDDIRESLSKLHFKSMSNYKILILDECHMLTTEAFNALLKDLEEPLDNVLFILCTTNPEKIPVTILSRCQTCEFKSINNTDIIDRLEYICKSEGFSYEYAALDLIARYSKGGMRDAISSLEKIACFSNGAIMESAVFENLNIISDDCFFDMINNIYNGKIDETLTILNDFVAKGKQPLNIFYQMQSLFSDILLYFFREDKKYNMNITKKQLLETSKLIIEYEPKLKQSMDKYCTLVSLFYEMSKLQNSNTDDLSSRLNKVEETIKTGKFGVSDFERIARINRALNGKKEFPKIDKQEPEGLVKDFLDISKGAVVYGIEK